MKDIYKILKEALAIYDFDSWDDSEQSFREDITKNLTVYPPNKFIGDIYKLFQSFHLPDLNIPVSLFYPIYTIYLDYKIKSQGFPEEIKNKITNSSMELSEYKFSNPGILKRTKQAFKTFINELETLWIPGILQSGGLRFFSYGSPEGPIYALFSIERIELQGLYDNGDISREDTEKCEHLLELLPTIMKKKLQNDPTFYVENPDEDLAGNFLSVYINLNPTTSNFSTKIFHGMIKLTKLYFEAVLENFPRYFK